MTYGACFAHTHQDAPAAAFWTGFPGESAEAHTELVDFVRDFKFERMGGEAAPAHTLRYWHATLLPPGSDPSLRDSSLMRVP